MNFCFASYIHTFRFNRYEHLNSVKLSYNFLPSDEGALRDRSPVRDPAAHRRNVRGNRGRGRGVGRGRGGRGRGGRERGGRVARPQDPELEWSRTYNPPADRPFVEPSPGPTQRYPADTRAGAFFDQMFTHLMRYGTCLLQRQTDTMTNKQQVSQTNIKESGILLPKTG